MKVLEPGRKQRGWATETTCTGKGNGGGGCGARLLVEEPDLFRTSRHTRDGSEHFVTFECVCCGVLSDVDNYPPGARCLLHVRRRTHTKRGRP